MQYFNNIKYLAFLNSSRRGKMHLQRNNINFSAIPKARYDACLKRSEDSIPVKLHIVELEKKDKKLIDFLVQNFDKFKAKKETPFDKERNLIFTQSLLDIQAIFRLLNTKKNKLAKKTKIFIGIVDKEPCGLIVANAPKVNNKGEVFYSVRNNKNESEIDWLVTWPIKTGEYIQNEGKALVAQLFHSTKAKNIKTIFVRSALPEKSTAIEFYKKMGFKQSGEKTLLNAAENNKEIAHGEYEDIEDDYIIPMEIKISEAKKIKQKVDKKLNRKPAKNQSVDITTLINMK
jgi:hypothetical protein